MSFAGFFLNNKHGVWAIVVAAVLLGWSAYMKIPVRLFPDTAPPLVNVVTSWAGATASDVDRDLTNVLESEFASLEGVARTTTTSQDNLSMVTIEFQYGTDVRMAAVDVQNAVNRIQGDLALGADAPRVLTFSTADRPVYTVGIAGKDMLKARQISEDVIMPRLQSIPGVAAVDVFGGYIPKVIVDVDPKKNSQAYHVPLPNIAAAIRDSNLSMPAGRVRSSRSETMLRVDNRAKRIEEFEDIVLPTPDGGQIRLGSLATFRHGAAQNDALFRINGKPAIAIQVYRSEDANTVSVVRAVQKVVLDLEKEQTTVDFIAGEETASFTDQSVSNLLANVWQALLLAALILFLFLGRARAALVTTFTMPLAFGITFAVMWLMGMEFNMVTLSAVILAVGMVVDASVVVLENIIRLRNTGLSPYEAAKQGTDEVLMPVMAGAATTLIVLIPLMALEGFIGRVFGPLALTLVIAFSSSVIVALIVVPILTLYIKDDGAIERAAEIISKPFRVSMDYTREGYLSLLNFGLRFRWAIVLFALIFLGAGVYGLLAGGMNLLPRMDGGAFTISLETASGTPVVETNKVVESVEAILKKHKEVVLVQSQSGFEPGMKFAGGSGVMGSTQGFLSVNLSPRTDRKKTIWDIEKQVREDINKIPGIVNVVIKEVGNTAKPTTRAPVIARITGPDLRVIDKLAGRVVTALEGVDSLVEPSRSWRKDMKRVLIDVDEERAAAIGYTPRKIGQMLVMGAEGIGAGTWTKGGRTSEDIEVRYTKSKEIDAAAMLDWPLFVANGDVVPIRSVAKIRRVTEQGLYTSINLNPVLDILAQVDGRPLNFVVADAKAAMSTLDFPDGYNVTIEGENNDLDESRLSILQALLMSVIAVYLLLVAQFHSWKHPVTVMMAVPLSLSGVALALFIVSKPVSMPVMVGLVLLVGTVVNNSILLVDLIRKSRAEGVERHEALRIAVSSRFRPIMMTSISTVVGMIPLAAELALGSERFSPLAIAVIGGMMAATLLTMVVIPVLYDLADSISIPWKKVPLLTIILLFIPMGLGAQTLEKNDLKQAWKYVQTHPAISASKFKMEAAEAKSQSLHQRLFPNIVLQANATLLSDVEPALIKLPIKLPDGSDPDPVQLGEVVRDQYGVGITLTQPLFVAGLMEAKRAAQAGQDLAAAEKEMNRSELWLSLVQVWYGYEVAKEIVDIQKEVVDAAKARETRVKRLVQGGRATQLQLSVLSLKRAEAEQSLAEAMEGATNLKYALAALTGKEMEQEEVDIVKLANASLHSESTKGKSPTILQAESRYRAADAMSDVAGGQLLPTLVLRLGAQYANPNKRYFPIKDEWNGSWDASIVFSWNIDLGVKWYEAKSAERTAAAAKSGVEAVKRQTELSIKQNAGVLKLSETKLKVAAERVKIAKDALRTSEKAMGEGRATSLDIIERYRDLGLAKAAQQKVALSIVILTEQKRALNGKFGFDGDE